MREKFGYWMPVHICYEAGSSKKLAEFIKGEQVLIISDPFLYQNGLAESIGNALKGKRVSYFSHIEPNPSCESVDEAAALAREAGADCVIGLGGGSSMDVAKMVSCLVSNEGSVYDYYSGGQRELKGRTAALVCIPTTAGTGSEVTNVGVFTNRKKGVKMPMVHDLFWPDYAIIDPELTYTLPPSVTASTGMDAFCHAIEAYWNKESVPVCDMLSMGAMKLILENIRRAYEAPEDAKARGAMLTASLIAGISFSQTRTTGIHALSFPLTTEFGASHGTACAVTLPAFVRLCQGQEGAKMRSLACYLGYDSAEELAQALEELMAEMDMPVRLSQIGVKKEDLQHIAQVGLSAAIIHLTPAEMNEKSVLALLESIL